MALLDGIKEMFGGKKGIDKISIDELKNEKIRLEVKERQISNEVDKIEAEKHKLFLKGKDETSQRQRLSLARKIKELDGSAKAKEQQLAFFHKHLRIVEGLLQVKTNIEMLRELKVGSIITKMSVEDLTAYVEKATVQGQFEMDKFTRLLESLDGATAAAEPFEADGDLAAIVALMEEAAAADAAGRPEAVEQAAKKADQLLNKALEGAVDA